MIKHGHYLATLLIFGLSTSLAADPGEVFAPHHHVAGFLGAGAETKRDGREKEIGIALGVEYEYRFDPKWGIGGLIEGLGKDTLRDSVVAVPVSFHPGGPWRLFFGPGYEFTEKHDKALLRVGAGYEFHIGGHWTLSPEIVGDFISGGAVTLLGGVAIGYEF